MSGSLEADAQSGDHGGNGVDPFRLECCLEIGYDLGAEDGVFFGARDDSGELGSRLRKLLGRPDPPCRDGGQKSEKLTNPLFVVTDHQPLDAPPGHDLPSSSERSFVRQREIRLAIVPGGNSRASPIAL